MAMGRPKAALVLDAELREQLENLANLRSLPAGLLRRAKIVLLSASGKTNQEIARQLGTSKATVGIWRRRFLKQGWSMYTALRCDSIATAWKEDFPLKNRIWLSVVTLAAMVSTAALAADVTGKWRAEFTTPDGTQRVNTFTFKQEGAKLTGTVAGAQDETPIQDGKVTGDDISFTAERPFGKFSYKGKLSGDEIQFKVEFGDNSFNITAKRMAK